MQAASSGSGGSVGEMGVRDPQLQSADFALWGPMVLYSSNEP